MEIQLDSIKFNHDPGGHETDALTLGRNGHAFVRVPEWRSSGGLVQSAVAYAVRGTNADALTVQARFRVPTPQLAEVEVRALDANNPAANVLGAVGRAAVGFNFETMSPFVTFPLHNTRLAGAGVGTHEVRWRWQVRVPPSQNFTDFAFTSHKIYTVLARPNAPWQQSPDHTDEFQLPWVEVLDWACRWAGGARDEDQAAELITRSLHALGPHLIRYDEHGGHSTYTHSTSRNTGARDFLCNRFLRLLRGEGLPPHRLVNCSDCATIVSVFANILGCSLSPSTMAATQPPDGVGFLLNQILPVGFEAWSPNFHFGRFSYHEVAWKGACTETDGVFDACLRLDRDADPFAAPHEPLLAVNMPFGFQGDRQYGDLLARNVAGGRNRCIPSREPITVKISNPLLPEPPLPPDPQFAALMDRFNFDLKRDLELPPENILIWNFRLLDEQLPDWQLVETSDLLNRVGRVRSLETIWRRADSDSYLRLDVYDCTSPEEARRVVFGLLGQTSHPDISRRAGIGEVTFALPSGILVLFARANLAVRVRDASDRPQSVEHIAEHLDRLLTEKPAGAGGFHELKAASVASAVTAAKPGEAVPLVSDALSARRGHSWYKFFSPSGAFRVIDGRPHYLVADVGEQEVSILQVDPDRKTKAGRMRFSL